MKFFEYEISLAISAAINAADKIMQIYNSADYEIRQKDDQTPVTEADLVSDEIIREKLSKTGIPVVSEEGISELGHTHPNGLYWLVDPLDGTKEFIRKNGEFCINIALLEHQIPISGIIAIPAKRILYAVSEKGRVFKAVFPNGFIDHMNTNELKRPDLNPAQKDKVVLMSRSHFQNSKPDPVLNALEKRYALHYARVGSAIKYTYLIEGKGDIYYRNGHTMEWDTAAGDALLRALGGGVFDLKTNEKLQYGKDGFLNSDFIASLMPIDQLL